MTCHSCRTECRKYGVRKGLQRYQCRQCQKLFTEPHERLFDRMHTREDRGLLALRMLLEGNSIRSVGRLTDLHRDTIMRLLVLAGERCEKVMGRRIRNLKVQDVELDECWSFIQMKDKRVEPGDDPTFGDCYVFVAIERSSKLVLNIAMGKRDQKTTDQFIEGLRHATGGNAR